MDSPYELDGLDNELNEDARRAAEGWLCELVVLSFRENKRGGDPIAHTADGRAVFPDKYQGGDDIRPGEHWVCSVSQKGESTFFAAPVSRLDATFLSGLLPEERQRLARVVAEEFPEVLESELQEAAVQGESGSFEQDPDGGRARELARERDELLERLGELNEQYDDAVTRLAEAESRLEGLQGGLGQRGEAPDDEEARAPSANGHRGAPTEERFPLTREGPSMLHCEGFPDGLYHGHVSPNGRTLFFKSYGRGPLRCEDGRLEVPGLEAILDDSVQELEARYDSRHGGFFVFLPRE